jgi:hypothetical protein
MSGSSIDTQRNHGTATPIAPMPAQDGATAEALSPTVSPMLTHAASSLGAAAVMRKIQRRARQGAAPTSPATDGATAASGEEDTNLLASVVGQELGTLILSAGTTEERPLRDERELTLTAQRELLPAGEEPQRFGGYKSQMQAILRGREVNTISVVLGDADGHFHVFDTGQAPLPAKTPSGADWEHHAFTTRPTAARVTSHRVVRAVQEDAIDFDQTRDRANASWNARGQEDHPNAFLDAQSQYDREMHGLVGNDVSVGQRSTQVLDHNEDTAGAEVVLNLRPDQQDTTELAHAGMMGAMPADHSTPNPEIAVPIVNRNGLSRSRQGLEQILIHEATHVAHSERSAALRERWDRSGSTLDFVTWLMKEHAAGRVGTEDAYIAQQATTGETAGTEVMARIEAFTSTYHRNPVNGPDAFQELSTIAAYWARPSATEDAALAPIRQIALERLYRYYAHGMDEAHRVEFDRWVADAGHLAGVTNIDPTAGRALLAPALQGMRVRFASEHPGAAAGSSGAAGG